MIAGRFIPNPCDYIMVQHLRARDELIEAKSEAGRLAETMLMLNDGASVAYRKKVLRLVKMASGKRASAVDTKILLQRKSARTPVGAASARAALTEEIDEIDDDIAETSEVLRDLGALD